MKFFFKIVIAIYIALSPLTILKAGTPTQFTVGWSLQPTSMDPHYKSSLSANNALLSHIFESLFALNSKGEMIPILIESFEVKNPNLWEFKIKSGVKFHDNTLLTSDDVIATFHRIKSLDSKNAYRKFMEEWGLTLIKIDDLNFEIHTKRPEPDLLWDLQAFKIISSDYKNEGEEAFNEGHALVGTGPYQLKERVDYTHFEFMENNNYHGKKPFVEKFNITVEKDVEKRLDGFIRQEFDLIDRMRPEDIDTLGKKNINTNLSMPSGTKLYIMRLDQFRDKSPYVRNNAGDLIEKNPLKDVRIRKAISLAIDRKYLIDKLFGGRGATPAGQIIGAGFKGYMPRLKPDVKDIKAAKDLLQEAGYPEGFQITIHDRDARKPVLEEIAVMLEKIGITTTVETHSSKIYFSAARNHEYSVAATTVSAFGSIGNALDYAVHTNGNGNSGRYSNVKIDSILDEANSTFDAAERYRMYSHAMELAVEDYAIIPLYFINDIWAIRPDMTFVPRSIGHTTVFDAYPNTATVQKDTDKISASSNHN